MKKGILGGVIAVSLVVLAVLAIYLFAVRTSSSYRMQQLQTTVGFIEEHIETLEEQRGLLEESVTALREQSVVLKKRVRQIDAEIRSMRELLGNARSSSKVSLFSWRQFHFTTASGLMVIAFLLFIWVLHMALRRERPADEGGLVEEEVTGSPGDEPVPGSVLEEEFPATEGTESPPAEDSTPADPGEAEKIMN